jgi:hypothetical protein
VLLLPEGRAALEVVHQEVAGLEGGAAMAGGRGHEDDRLARRDAADAVDDAIVVQVEPALAASANSAIAASVKPG